MFGTLVTLVVVGTETREEVTDKDKGQGDGRYGQRHRPCTATISHERLSGGSLREESISGLRTQAAWRCGPYETTDGKMYN